MLIDSTLLKRNEEKFLFSKIGEEVVMMNLETGNYVGFNSVAADIWGHLEKPMTALKIVDKLSEIYDVTKEQCQDEVFPFLEEMIEREMITVEN